MTDTTLRIPIGGKQLAPAHDATDEQLSYFLEWYEAQNDTAKAKYLRHADAARAVQASRQTAITVNDVDSVNARLREFSDRCHLVTPATHVDVLPVGFGVTCSYLTPPIDPDPKGRDVYRVDGGKLALTHHALMRIASVAGVSWLPGYRCDDGSSPQYLHHVAMARIKEFDGTARELSAQVQIDARDGSALANRCREIEAAAALKYRRDPIDPPKQLTQIREYIVRHGESKARNRILAAMGVARSYVPHELQRPFACARLSFNGHSDDPELRRELALLTAKAALQSTQQLYGGNPAAQAPVPHPNPQPPPPVNPEAAPTFNAEEYEPWD